MKKYAKSVIIISSLLLAVYIVGLNWYVFTQNRWEVREYTRQSINVPECPTIPSKNDIYKLVRKEFNSWCIYFECDDLGEGVNGRACPQINAVFIKKGLNSFDYTMTLAHEISHCKLKTIYECRTEYNAIVKLIESDNEYLHFIGMYWANNILNEGKAGTEYDCGYYLDKYLKGE